MSNPTIAVIYDPRGSIEIRREFMAPDTEFALVHLNDVEMSESELRDYLDSMMRQLFVVRPDDAAAQAPTEAVAP